MRSLLDLCESRDMQMITGPTEKSNMPRERLYDIVALSDIEGPKQVCLP